MNKKIAKALILIIVLCSTIATSYAAPSETSGESEKYNKNKTIFDTLLPRPGEDPSTQGENPELEAVADLPEVIPEAAITSVIKTILGASMILTIIAIGVVAFYQMSSQGQEEDLNKAKDIMLYLIIGMAIMAAAYGIISGVSQFNFFK